MRFLQFNRFQVLSISYKFIFIASLLSVGIISKAQIKAVGPSAGSEDAEAIEVVPELEVFEVFLYCADSANEVTLFKSQNNIYRAVRVPVLDENGDTRIPNSDTSKFDFRWLPYHQCRSIARKEETIYECPSKFNQGIIVKTIPGTDKGQITIKFGAYLMMKNATCGLVQP